jgi:RES domain
VLARIADDDGHLRDIFDLDNATNDRLLAENNLLPGIGIHELVFGIPHYRIVNAAFCHAHPLGSRFNGPDRGAWYACFELETSQAEVAFHKSVEMPVSVSGVMLGVTAWKIGALNTGPPANSRSAIALLSLSFGVWQLPQATMPFTRYLPRSIGVSARTTKMPKLRNTKDRRLNRRHFISSAAMNILFRLSLSQAGGCVRRGGGQICLHVSLQPFVRSGAETERGRAHSPQLWEFAGMGGRRCKCSAACGVEKN